MSRIAVAAFFVLIAMSASAEDNPRLITVRPTEVFAEPDERAAVLATLDPHVVLVPDQRKDFWYHISIITGKGPVNGWVHEFDVNAGFGRSKGQLLAQNENMLTAIAELRAENARLKEQLADTKAELDRVAAENAWLKHAPEKVLEGQRETPQKN